ncbi:hypothetical protein FF36_04150 [Frankia torreyi]|uniref:Uncharacterized protein n=1 Tax=Frankia torreyi TaxID=1856 RepID=A0A0D8BBL6_9ACTN|nr:MULTISPECIES: hypothetical protein [Frankia]KJE21576.1 hypothetical protein FF36_04150 [Frankia torreyi]
MSDSLRQRLADLPPETDPGFGTAARALLAGPDAGDEALTAIIEGADLPEQTRFNAFYCLQVRAWRRKDHRRHRANTDRYQSRFGRHPMFFYLQAEYYAALGDDPANLDAALTFAVEAVERLASVPGVLHLAAEVIADRHERDPDSDPRLLLDAERHVRQAIALSDGRYARYHATHARIATLRGAFTTARASIARAIEDEDSTGAEYALRIGDGGRQRVGLASAGPRDRRGDTRDGGFSHDRVGADGCGCCGPSVGRTSRITRMRPVAVRTGCG